jgi:hypothetical protein
MKSTQINLEKFKLLKSGLVDDGSFNEKVKKIRERLNIHTNGLSTSKDHKEWEEWLMNESDKVIESNKWKIKLRNLNRNDSNFEKMNRELHREIPVNFLKYAVEDLIAENPDLNGGLESLIREYIVSGDKMLPILSNYRIKIQEKNNKKIPTIEIYGQLTSKELAGAMKMIEIFNKHYNYFSTTKPLKDIDRDIKIKKLSKKKGARLKSRALDIEDNGKFSDETIVSKTFSEDLDTNKRIKANRALVRKRRSRLEERIKELFPNTAKKSL